MTSHRTNLMSRRSLGAIVGAAGVGGLTAPWASANENTEQEFRSQDRGRPPRRPNVLVILADDLGWADLSSYGAPDIRTPHLDRLALSGIRFTQGYSASAVCSPTRFGLYTGRYPGRLPGGNKEPIAGPSEVDGIPLDHPTLASLLKGEGYRTAMFGKWHCGYLPWFSPTRLGWDQFFGNFGGGVDYFSKLDPYGDHDLFENEVEVQDLRYYTEIITEKAVDFIVDRHDGPWLLNLNFTTPHWPWEGPGDREVSDELSARAMAGDQRAMFHGDGGSRATYAEMVEDLDRSVGLVIAALERTGQRRETVVLFASDNGGERFSYSWPLSGAKGSTLEGGIRVPTILSWPGVLPNKTVNHHPVVTMDWTATLLDLGGAVPGNAHPLDGVSLVSHLFRGRPAPQRDLFWRMRTHRALRRGDLKYFRGPDGVDKLFDLADDSLEQANLAVSRPDDLAMLRASWESIAKQLIAYS